LKIKISITATTPTTTPAPDLLLPRSVLPIHYNLNIEPNHNSNQFFGTITVELNVTESTNIIKIHSYLLTVTDPKVTDSSDQSLELKNFTYDQQKQYHTIELNNQITVGNDYSLTLSFNGSLIGKIIGFYKSVYTNSHNQIRFDSKHLFYELLKKSEKNKKNTNIFLNLVLKTNLFFF